MKKFAFKAILATCASLPLAAPAFAQDTPVNGDIVFSSPGTNTYFRDIRLSDNKGGIRIFATPSLTAAPAGADMQFFGNQNPYFPGHAYIDAGAVDTGAIILRTAPTGSNIIERFRINSAGNVGIGVNNPTQKLEINGNIKINGAANGIIFPDGSLFRGIGSGLSMNNAQITNLGNPVAPGDATTKAYTDANFVKFVPGAEQLSVGDSDGTAPMINLRGGSTCCASPGGHTPAWFKVFQNGSFVATGNLGIGTNPKPGPGWRTSWDTYKAAFRSGYADTEWDGDNVGFYSWAGGSNSTASGLYAFAFGDTNYARSTSSVAFGSNNEVKGAAGFSAGAGNRVCDTYGVALGNNARSGGPYINGKCDPDTFNIRGLAAVAIGYNVTADQDHTMALGKWASNNGFQGTFIWSDASSQSAESMFRNIANNEFAARATGGFRFRTNFGNTTGCNLPAGSGVFNCTSSRTTKTNFAAVSGTDVLAKVRALPITTWNYISEGDKVRHIGPMAEDFHAAFGLGDSNKAIGVQDLASVSLAGVKALEERTAELQSKTEELERLRGEVASLRTANAALEDRLTAIEASLKRN